MYKQIEKQIIDASLADKYFASPEIAQAIMQFRKEALDILRKKLQPETLPIQPNMPGQIPTEEYMH